MKYSRKVTCLSAVLLLSIWILPLGAQAIPRGCMCCDMAECCCGCNQKKSSAADEDRLQTSPCNCTISENGRNETPVFLTSKDIKSKYDLSLSTSVREERKPVPKENKAVLTNNISPFKFISLIFLKDSFLL